MPSATTAADVGEIVELGDCDEGCRDTCALCQVEFLKRFSRLLKIGVDVMQSMSTSSRPVKCQYHTKPHTQMQPSLI